MVPLNDDVITTEFRAKCPYTTCSVLIIVVNAVNRTLNFFNILTASH